MFTPRAMIRSAVQPGVAGNIAITAPSIVDPIAIDTLGASAWLIQASSADFFTEQAAPTGAFNKANFTSPGRYGGATNNNTLSGSTTLTANSGAVTNSAIGRSFAAPAGLTTEQGVTFRAPASATPQTLRLFLKGINFSGNDDIKVRATLSDGSFAPQLFSTTALGSTKLHVDIAFNAAGPGQTLLIEIFPGDAANGAQFGFVGVALI